MLLARIAGVSAVTLSFLIYIAKAQTPPDPERLQSIQQRTANVKQQAIGKLPSHLQKALSGGALNYFSVRAVGRAAIKYYESRVDPEIADEIWSEGDREHA